MGTQLLPSIGWIVCGSRTLPVEDGRVSCPLRGRVTPDLCVTCHFLETIEAERDSRLSCSAEPAHAAVRRVSVDPRLEDVLVGSLLDEPQPPAGVASIAIGSRRVTDPIADLIGVF